jgi:large subunit ribosomal protein L33
MAAKENRIVIKMACTSCKSINYVSSKNRVKHPNRLELKKYCNRPSCRKHTVHREEK